MAELTGFDAAQESAIEVLAELLIKYMQEVCTAAHSYAEMAHRTDFNICDLTLALSDMGTSMDDLKKYLDTWLAEQVSMFCWRDTHLEMVPLPNLLSPASWPLYTNGMYFSQIHYCNLALQRFSPPCPAFAVHSVGPFITYPSAFRPFRPSSCIQNIFELYHWHPHPFSSRAFDTPMAQGPGSFDQGFVHPLPSEYPVRAPGRSLPSWEERREEPPPHIPSWLPAFPDRHTYVRTPAFPGHEEDPVKQSEVGSKQQQDAAPRNSKNPRMERRAMYVGK